MSARALPRRRLPGGRRGPTLLLGAVVLALLCATAVFAYTADQGLPFARTTTVTAAFDEVGSLRVGDDVRVASYRIGRVHEVTYREGRAIAVLELVGELPVHRDATVTTASVGARSALGQKFVDLDPGSPGSGLLGPGDIVAQRETRGAQELGDLFAVFDEPTRTAMGAVLRETGGGLVGRQDDLSDLLATAPDAVPALGEVSATLAADDGADLTALLQAADLLSGRFAGREQQLADLVGEMETTLAAFTVDGSEPLSDTLEIAPGALPEVRAALDSLNGPLADTEAAMTDLRPGAEALGAALPDLRGVLVEGVAPLETLPGVMDSAEPAVDELTPAMADFRPLAPRLARTLHLAVEPLGVLEPYAPEISQFFTGMTSAMSDGDAAGHWLRVIPLFGSESVTGAGVPLDDPAVARNAYPAPGEAEGDTRRTPLSGGNR